MSILQWWRSGPAHRRLRRRLVILSAPVAVALVLVAVKAVSVDVAEHSARAFSAAGTLAVLEGRIEDADEQFTASLARSDPSASCPVRVNLEIVRETLGDRAAGTFDTAAAVEHYRAASVAVTDAPTDCFAGNTDGDEERRALRENAASRLADKIAAAQSTPPAPAQVPAPAAPPPPPPATGAATDERERQLRLDPSSGDPLERLQQILRDAAAAAQ